MICPAPNTTSAGPKPQLSACRMVKLRSQPVAVCHRERSTTTCHKVGPNWRGSESRPYGDFCVHGLSHGLPHYLIQILKLECNPCDKLEPFGLPHNFQNWYNVKLECLKSVAPSSWMVIFPITLGIRGIPHGLASPENICLWPPPICVGMTPGTLVSKPAKHEIYMTMITTSI